MRLEALPADKPQRHSRSARSTLASILYAAVSAAKTPFAQYRA